MKAVTPVLLQDPSGVERELRFTQGARKRIFEKFGSIDVTSIWQEKGDWAIAETAYYMMFDSDGNPPSAMSLDQWMEVAVGDDENTTEIAAAIISAISQGKTSKNEVAERLTKIRSVAIAMIQDGLKPGLSADSVSDSPTLNIGGDTPTENSPPSLSSTETKSETGPS
jgi:hypothetical protein